MTAPTPMRAQMTAADPALSVWVSANAGTGKTKVLTDRVLRLLLAGTEPSRILCITYTKAAAAEMENRIHETLSDWVALDDATLAEALRRLTGDPPRSRDIRRARSLFALVLDAPEGVRIQTIHSLCQSLLRRFPLEAGVQPHFEVIDERTGMELLAEAKHRLFTRSFGDEERELAEAIQSLAGRMAENRFHELLKLLIDARRHLLPALNRHDGKGWLIDDAYAVLGVTRGQTEAGIIREVFAYDSGEECALRDAINALEAGAKTDFNMAQDMVGWWQADPLHRVSHWLKYRSAWLTADGEPKANIEKSKVIKADASRQDALRREQARAVECETRLRALQVAQLTEACIRVVDGICIIYNHLKEIHQFLDYDDLVMLSVRLLQRPGIAPWVLYKLDGGVDHLLIDEAQDTSPEQWQLVEKLVGDFYSGAGRAEARGIARTLFVVGDEKQSIYSFQGAAPRAFSAKRDQFAALAEAARKPFRPVSLGMSFRSTEAVLRVVDAVLSQPHVRAGVSFHGDIVPHEAFREGQAGLVEVWPVIRGDEREEVDIWDVHSSVSVMDSQVLLAERMANNIHDWLVRGERLESLGRPIRAGDVLVLVRRRNAFMHHLLRALKRRDVPVAGVDRMVLTENIAVMDMLALAEFLLLPEDDLNLACLLKSPLCGVAEEQLFMLAHGRGQASLWSRVQASGELTEAAGFLGGLLERVDYIRPYELFAQVLEGEGGRSRFAARMGSEVFDPLDEFLALALEYERNHAPSLQGFLHWMRSGDTQIKRDMEQGQDAVRIMTVHGSKGLQAPIVFLPDTVGTVSDSGGRLSPLFWTEKDGQPVMLWSPSAKEDDPVTAGLRAACRRAEEEEYRRLLYVAMTRAEDRLYVCGALGRNRKEVPEGCWYSWIRSGIEGLAQPCVVTFLPARPGGEAEAIEVLRYETPQTVAPRKAVRTHRQKVLSPMPEALRQPPAPEPYPPQPLVPSRSDSEAVVASGGSGEVLSPVQEGERFQRGNLIHRLLQWLPDTPTERRAATGEAYLARYAAAMPETERVALLREVLAVLDDVRMAPVFAPGSLAEVPVSGLVALQDGALPRILSGQIDRLRVTDEAVWIVDYKTQRLPPARAEEVPVAYLRQMAVYRAALMRIYPDRPVHCALLWTAAPALMPLPAGLLASSLDSARN